MIHPICLIILTDALANTGQLNPQSMLRSAQIYDADRQVDFVLIGVGAHFNHDLARTLSEKDHNTVHFIDDAEDIQKVFVDELGSLVAPVAKDARRQWIGTHGQVHCLGCVLARLW